MLSEIRPSSGPYEICLSTKLDQADLDALLQLKLPEVNATNFHFLPSANIRADGSYALSVVMANASFHFAKWLPD